LFFFLIFFFENLLFFILESSAALAGVSFDRVVVAGCQWYQSIGRELGSILSGEKYEIKALLSELGPVLIVFFDFFFENLLFFILESSAA
jgi:hypothetical protein